MLCLDGVSLGHLENVLDYIYFGEDQIYPEDIHKFLDIAEKLKLHGLIGSKDKVSKDESILSTVNEVKTLYSPIENYTKTENLCTLDKAISKTVQKPDKIMVDLGNFSSIDDLDNHIQQQMIITSDGRQCGICFYNTQKYSNLKEHIETHFEGLKFPCVNCNNPYPSRPSLRYHMRKCGKK